MYVQGRIQDFIKGGWQVKKQQYAIIFVMKKR